MDEHISIDLFFGHSILRSGAAGSLANESEKKGKKKGRRKSNCVEQPCLEARGEGFKVTEALSPVLVARLASATSIVSADLH